jgi:hypothetical protein
MEGTSIAYNKPTIKAWTLLEKEVGYSKQDAPEISREARRNQMKDSSHVFETDEKGITWQCKKHCSPIDLKRNSLANFQPRLSKTDICRILNSLDRQVH